MRRSRAFSPANIALFCTIFIHITDFLNADSDIVDPCKRQPFRGRCPPTKDNRQTRSQFVLRYYLRSGECVSYPYGYCANDENEPRLFRYKEECEDACLNEATENTVSTSFGLNNAVGLLNVGHDGSQPTVPSEHEEIEETTQHQETYGTNAPLKHDEYQTPKTECQRQRERATGGLIKGGFVPECTQTGAFKPLQCEPDEKTCFCVNSDGIELKNSRCQPGEPKPDCEKISSATPMRTNECTGGAESGPCRAPSQRWFYDEASQECRSFMYSGCGGNGNNYASEEACHRRCVNEDDSQKCAGGVSALRNSQTGNTVDCAKTDCPTGYKCNIIQESHHICCPDVEKSIDAGILHSGLKPTRCEQSKDRGPCDKYELRFYYDTTSNACKYFFYGGCEGNENNFKQIDECEQLCGPVEKTSSSATQSNSITTTSHSPTPSETTESESTRQQTIFSTVVIPEKETQGSENTQSTSMASSSPSTTESTNVAETSQATVDAKKPSTSFEIAMEIATEKTTTEAPATETRSSPTRPQPTLPSQETIRTKPPTTTVPLPANSCQHPLDRGQCGGQFVRWWWNAESRFCETFMYTGCGGNGNNFASREECLGRCHKEAVKPIVAQDVDLSRVCDSDIDVGECGGTFMRYAFDRATNECRQFKYGGCGGNGNNFASMADCKLKCLKKKGANAKSALASQQALPTNICEHEVDSGECTGLFNRYAYDSSTNECRAFNYGGCGGNGNNFANVEDCRTACVKVKCAPEPECDASRCQLVRDAHGCPFCSCPPVPRHPPFNRALSTAAPSRIQCPAFELNACTEPCIVFTNRVGCRECVCPVLPSSPASSAPSSHCAPFEMSACATPCVVFTNRGGCHECVCPVNPDILPREKPGNDRDTSAPDLPPSRAPSTQSRSTRPQSPVTSAPPPLGAFGSKNNNEIDDIPPPSPVAFGELGEKCTQPLDPGPCDRFVTRWHFNLVRAECEPFQYGGCAGNRNHFFTQTECMVHCGRFLLTQQSISQSVNTEGTQRPAQPSQPTARPVLQAITTTTLASIDDTCLLPPESGPCTNYVPRWFFNAQTAKCEMFSYGSCNGNTNNFMTRDECEKRCQIEIDQFTAQLPERCTRPRSEGVGSGYFPKWYYNQKNMRCEQFVYLGTGGNDNRFSNFADCELFCKFSKNIDENTKRVKEAEFSIPPPSPAQIVEKTTVAPTTHEEPRFFAPKFTPKPILSFKGSKSISAEVEQSGERRHSGEQQPNDIFGVVNAKTNDGDKSNNIAQPIEEEVELTAEKPRYPQDRIETNAESPHGKLPIIAPSIKSGINYQTGQSVGGKEAENDVTNPRAFGLSSHVPTKNDETQNFDKIPDASKSVFDSTGESAEEIKVPICPNGLNAMRYADGRPVMCLPGRNQCPNKSVCYFNGIDYFCCPNEDDPYDKHVFGGYDGEEVKHGYKDYPAQLSIRSIRRSRRDAAMLPPPISFSLDQVQSSLRFDDKPVHRISSAGLLERVSPCLEEMQRGSCNGALHRFFYDIHNDQCRLFYYSGCGGNTNNFVTKEDCTQRCKIGSVLMSNRNSLSDSIGSVIAAATVTESSTLLALGQCPNGETPLGDAAPVLCGNRTDSIGCPVGFYCRMGPPDICCPTAVGEEERIDIHQVLQAQRGDVRRKPFVSGAGAVDHEHAHSEQAHGVSTHDAKYNTDEDASAPANADQSAAGEQEIAHVSSHNGVPSTMCPDGSDSLLAANGAAIQCGTGSDGHELCPSGYYCSIDLERNGRLCCPLAIQGSNLPAPGAIAPYFGHRGTNPGEVIERGSLPTDPKPPKLVTPPSRHRQQTAIRPMDYDDERSHPSPNNNAHVASVHEGISANEVPPAVMPQASGTEYDHLILRSSTASLAKATETYKLNRFENAAIKGEFGNDDPFDSDRGQARESKTGPDFKVKTCLQPPSDGRACQMGEASPRSNLQFFYSEQDHVCKVFFYRGCGGNANRFETKRECEQYCGVVKA